MMSKITLEEKSLYFDKIKPYREIIKKYIIKEEKTLASLKKDNPDSGYIRIDLIDDMLNLASYYIILSGISQSMLKQRNEEALNDGRKAIYKAVIYLEEVVSSLIDAPFSEYEEKLDAIESFDPNQRYRLICKMGLAIDLMQLAYGDNSKWRWTFVEIEGRFAAVAKNIVNLKNVYSYMTPESEYYDSAFYHVRLIKKLLAGAADRYREKYELSTGQIHDFKTGINFLAALRRMHIVLGENEDSQDIKKKLSIWSQKLDADLKKQEEEKKKK